MNMKKMKTIIIKILNKTIKKIKMIIKKQKMNKIKIY